MRHIWPDAIFNGEANSGCFEFIGATATRAVVKQLTSFSARKKPFIILIASTLE